MEMSFKVNILMIKSTDGESLLGQTVRFIKVSLEMISGMDKEHISIQVEKQANFYGNRD